jgi:manganese transport protein
MDPGNFATNIQGGAKYGYRLLWVVVFANLTAMLFQALSAKLGIATGKNLAELCREHFPRPVSLCMWVVSEVAAMATDLAEFLGATVGLNLLFHLPLLVGAVITGIATYGVLMLQRAGFRPIEAFIGALVGVMAASYLVETFFARPDWGSVLQGATVPWLGDSGAVLLAVGVVGATVMPHAVFIHSGLTQDRVLPEHAGDRRKILRFSNLDVLMALSLAGLVNLAMMYMAAATFYPHHSNVADLSTAYQTLTPLLGGAAALVFLISLLTSGLASSAVGTMAGQVIMQGFVGFSIPLWLRRLLTMVPSIVVIAMGVNATQALVVSQVVLSLVLPVPVIALVVFTRRRSLMGDLVNRRLTSVLATAGAAAILCLNVVLLVETIGVPLPGIR